MQSLGPYAPGLKEDFFHRLTPYFQKLKVAKGESLWSIGDTADANEKSKIKNRIGCRFQLAMSSISRILLSTFTTVPKKRKDWSLMIRV